MKTKYVLDLFSGIGGFSLGLEAAGMQTVAFCEKEDFPCRVLRANWPRVPIYRDIKELTYARLRSRVGRVDLICGGFPCQDISNAGPQIGIRGERSGLWFEFARLIGEVGPRWVVIENVSALRSRGLSTVLQNLCSLGYDAEWHCVPASAIGAPHERDRVWIVANRNSLSVETPEVVGQTKLYREIQRELGRVGRGADGAWGKDSQPGFVGVDDGVPDWVDRSRALGNSVVPKIPEILGRAIISVEEDMRP